jgi:hypothetical protein
VCLLTYSLAPWSRVTEDVVIEDVVIEDVVVEGMDEVSAE